MKTRTAKILKVLGILAVALSAGYLLLAIVAKRSISRAHALVESRGQATGFEQVAPPSVADVENAALLYQAAVLMLQSQALNAGGASSVWDEYVEIHRLPEKDGDAERSDRLRALLKHPVMDDWFALMGEASRKPGYASNLDFSKSVMMEMDPLMNLLWMSKILEDKARMDIEAGNPDEAWKAVIIMLRMACAPGREPSLVAQLVRDSQLKGACKVIRSLPYDPAHHEEADRLLAAFDDPSPWVLAIDGERLLLHRFCEGLRAGDAEMNVHEMIALYGVSNSASRRNALMRTWTMIMWAAHQRLDAISLLDQAEIIRTYSDVAGMMAGEYSRDELDAFSDRLEDLPIHYILTKGLGAGFPVQIKRMHAMLATSRMARLHLVLMRERGQQGDWPEVLPNAPRLIDPFNQQPFHYRVDGDSYVLQSMGPGRVDDEGQENDGIVWHYPNEG